MKNVESALHGHELLEAQIRSLDKRSHPQEKRPPAKQLWERQDGMPIQRGQSSKKQKHGQRFIVQAVDSPNLPNTSPGSCSHFCRLLLPHRPHYEGPGHA